MSSKKKETILIVDDNRENLKLLAAIIKGAGYDPAIADNGYDAVKFVDRKIPSAVLLDVMMPGMNGYEACEIILKKEGMLNVPVIFVTAKNDPEDYKQGFRSGGVDYISKPFDEEILLARLKTHLDNSRLKINLAKSEQALKFAQKVASIGHWYIEKTTRRIYGKSDEFNKIFDFAENKSSGFDVDQMLKVINTEDREKLSRSIDTLFDTGTPFLVDTGVETLGEVKYFQHRGQAIRDKDNNITGAFGTTQDVTAEVTLRKSMIAGQQQLRKKERELLQTQKIEAVGRLAGGVAHDFNNILQIIIGYSDLLKNILTPDSDQYASKMLHHICGAASKAKSLVQQLLLFSRREGFKPENLDIYETLLNLKNMIERIVGDNISVELAGPEQRLYMNGDPGQLEQVILNLCTNARDSMEDNGTISIKLGTKVFDEPLDECQGVIPEGSYIEIMIKDNGAGIAPKILPRIFDPFFTTKDVGKGTGLGLSSVLGIVRNHDGFIRVVSEPDLGTKVFLYFKLDPSISGPDKKSDTPLKPSKEPKTKFSGKLLLAEDSQDVSLFMVHRLAEMGFDVYPAEDGLEAEEIFNDIGQELSVAVLDVMMPGKKGTDVLKTIRKSRPDLPVLFVSGYTDDSIDMDVLKEKKTMLLRKPFNSDSLAKNLKELLDA
jgi:DNA-binding response OmpR family regulator